MTATGTFQSDYQAATEGTALLDRSERGKLALTGAGAKEFLQGQVTQDVNGLGPGHGAYSAFLTQKGKMLGDLRVLDTGDELLLDTERPALQELFNMIRHFSLGHDLVLHKRTLETGLLSLIGPGSAAVLGSCEIGASEHDHAAVSIAGVAARVVRTDIGVDVLMPSERIDAVRAALIDGGAVEIGSQAAECVRIESGRPRYGVDLDESVIPQEAGLNGRAVSFTKGCYVGQETVARLFYRGKPNRELRGLRSDEVLPSGTVLTVKLDDGSEREIGTVTSSVRSPKFGAIALALVRREAPSGTEVDATQTRATVVELPFT